MIYEVLIVILCAMISGAFLAIAASSYEPNNTEKKRNG